MKVRSRGGRVDGIRDDVQLDVRRGIHYIVSRYSAAFRKQVKIISSQRELGKVHHSPFFLFLKMVCLSVCLITPATP